MSISPALSEDSLSSRRRKSQPTGSSSPPILILLLALLVLVGFQTILQLRQSPLDRMFVAMESLSGNTKKSGLPHRQESRYLQRPMPPFYSTKQQRTKLSLEELTNPDEPMDPTCTDPKRWLFNENATNTTGFQNQKIPLLIHQTSRSRCVHRHITTSVNEWRNLPMYRYILHDDEAMWKLLNQEWPEFPHLRAVVRCLNSMTAVTDIWRLLVLWEYGGIYSDMDSVPNSWTPEYIDPNDDAFFVVEQYHAPSQYFMAARPRHALLYYAIQEALVAVLKQINIQKIDAAYITGPFALLGGFERFTADGGFEAKKPIPNGTYVGPDGWTVRLVGEGGQITSDAVILRESIPRERKMKLYAKVNMTHYHDDTRRGRSAWKLGRSCLAISYDLLIGPPSDYRQQEHEDRETVAGIS